MKLRATPLRNIDLKRVRDVKSGSEGASLGTLAILLAPLAIAGLLVWRSR